MEEQVRTQPRLGRRTWAALLTFGLFGQIAWVIENMYFNVFLYNTISGDTAMIFSIAVPPGTRCYLHMFTDSLADYAAF